MLSFSVPGSGRPFAFPALDDCVLRYSLLVISCFVSCAAVSAHSDQRPNIILIMTDDQGYGDFGFTGNPVIQTPSLDDLASSSL